MKLVVQKRTQNVCVIVLVRGAGFCLQANIQCHLYHCNHFPREAVGHTYRPKRVCTTHKHGLSFWKYDPKDKFDGVMNLTIEINLPI